jgi:hypothetical protein
VEPSEQIRRKFTAHPVFQMEKEFYEFALAEFDSTWKKAAMMAKNGKQFHFEKIRP